MNTSNKVDVIIATGDHIEGHEGVASPLGDTVEAVDVAPDPKRRIIMIAPTKAAGQEYAELLGIEPVAIVTPRSPHASYGLTADEIVEAPELTADVVAELMSQAARSLAATEGA